MVTELLCRGNSLDLVWNYKLCNINKPHIRSTKKNITKTLNYMVNVIAFNVLVENTNDTKSLTAVFVANEE